MKAAIEFPTQDLRGYRDCHVAFCILLIATVWSSIPLYIADPYSA